MNKLKRKFGKRMKYNYKRTFFGMFVFLFFAIFGVGYAYLTTNLSIDGTSSIKGSKWDVHFENVQVKEGSVETEEPVISDDTTVSFNATLENPGDFYEFTVDVVNEGTLDARISSVEVLPILTEEEKEYFNYEVDYTTDLDVTEEDLLLAGRTRTIKITFEYLENDDENNYPDTDKEFEFKLDLDYEQLPNNYYPCTYEGELVNNTSYQNGQYEYFYLADVGGWKASLIDRNSTEPVTTKLCTTINGKPIVNMNGMFASSKAVSIDTSSFDTSKVTDMGAMFVGVKAEELDFSSFDTSNVTNMSSMFANAEVKKLDLSSFNTSKVTDFSSIFANNSNLINLNLSNWDFRAMNRFTSYIYYSIIPNLKKINLSNSKLCSNMSFAFSSYSYLEEIDLKNVDTSAVTNMASMFANVKVEKLDLSSFNTSKVTDISGMFYNASNIKSLNLSSFDTSNVTSFGGLFSGNTSITDLNMSNWDYSNMTSSFRNNISLTSLPNLKRLNVSNSIFPSDMSAAFNSLSSLEEINLNNVDTSNVTNMSLMFNRIPNLTTIDVSDFDTSKVVRMDYMFADCDSLTNMDLSNFNTTSVSTMLGVFAGCSNLESINLSNIDFRSYNQSNTIARMVGGESYSVTTSSFPKLKTINLTNTKYPDTIEQFAYLYPVENLILSRVDTSNITNMKSWFSYDENLKSLDLSSFNTSRVIYMSQMFYGVGLNTLDLSGFKFDAVEDYEMMFQGSALHTVYVKNQSDANVLSLIPSNPSTLSFVVR